MKNLIINEELKNLLPPLSPEEFAGLEESILKDGCLSPLIVWNDVLVDGHNRYEICTKHQIPFGTQNIVLESLDDAKFWAWKHQENRRNLAPFHRGELALKLKDVIAAKAKERQIRKPADSVPPKSAEQKETRQELAQIAGLAPSTLGQVQYITEHADEETKDKLRRGEKGTSINKEYNRLKAEEKTNVTENASEPTNEPEENDTYPEPPCPNKDVKYFPKTTLKLIPQESPHVLLGNLFAHFRKGFVEEMVVMAMEMIRQKLGDKAVQKIMKQLNKEFGK